MRWGSAPTRQQCLTLHRPAASPSASHRHSMARCGTAQRRKATPPAASAPCTSHGMQGQSTAPHAPQSIYRTHRPRPRYSTWPMGPLASMLSPMARESRYWLILPAGNRNETTRPVCLPVPGFFEGHGASCSANTARARSRPAAGHPAAPLTAVGEARVLTRKVDLHHQLKEAALVVRRRWGVGPHHQLTVDPAGQ